MGHYSQEHDRYIGMSEDEYNRRKADEVLGCFFMTIVIMLIIAAASWLASIFGLK